MARKILAGILIALSAIFLVLSLVGIGAIWFYHGRLTDEVTSRLTDIDNQMAQAQTTLQSSEKELQRALRIVDAGQAALDKLKKQTNTAGNLVDTIKST
jgi:predicted PurR-regulated permease PerM